MYVSACQQQRGSSGYREEEGPLSTNTNPIRYIAAYWGERERGWERAPHHCVERQAGAVAGGGGMDACSFALSMLEEVLILWNRSHSHIRRDIYFIFNSRIMGPIGGEFVDADLDLCLIYVHASSYLCLPSPSLSLSLSLPLIRSTHGMLAALFLIRMLHPSIYLFPLSLPPSPQQPQPSSPDSIRAQRH